MAGAEIVERDRDALALQVGKLGQRRFGALLQPRLGHLHLKPPRRQPDALQCRRHAPGQAAAVELAAREVDRDPRRVLAARPAGCVGASREQCPAPDLRHAAAALGRGEEVGGQQFAALGVVPAQQSLEPHDAAVAEANQRLVQHAQLAERQGGAQIALQRTAALCGGVQLGREVLDPSAPLRLGAVESQIAETHCLLGRVGLPRDLDDADAGAHRRGLATQQEGPAEQVHGPRAHRPRGLLPGTAQQQRELVATQPGQRVAAADRAGKPFGDQAQQLVAGGVAERVVDRLEAVEVEQQKR